MHGSRVYSLLYWVICYVLKWNMCCVDSRMFGDGLKDIVLPQMQLLFVILIFSSDAN